MRSGGNSGFRLADYKQAGDNGKREKKRQIWIEMNEGEK